MFQYKANNINLFSVLFFVVVKDLTFNQVCKMPRVVQTLYFFCPSEGPGRLKVLRLVFFVPLPASFCKVGGTEITADVSLYIFFLFKLIVTQYFCYFF